MRRELEVEQIGPAASVTALGSRLTLSVILTAFVNPILFLLPMRFSNKLWLLLPALCGVLVLTSCDSVDFGNINEDNDAVNEPSTEGLLSGAMNRFFTLAGRNYHVRPLLYMQYMSQNVYTTEQRYGQSPQPWSGYYVQTLSNLQQVVDINTAEEVGPATRAYGAPVNQTGVAELMSVFIWKRLTNTWGPVPYTEALGAGDNLTVPYTDQETIYKDLIERAKAARDMLDPNVTNPTGPVGPTGDAIYGGDVTKWKKMANSLIMTMALQLSDKYPSPGGYAATAFSEALNHPAGVIEDIPAEMWYDHANTPGAENPFTVLRPADYNISEPFVEALTGEADNDIVPGPPVDAIGYSNDTYDARIDVYAGDPSLGGRPYGYATVPPEEEAGPYANVADVIFSDPSAPMPYLTAAYTYLNRAEAAVLGWTSEDPEEMFELGVEHSYQTVDYHYDDGSATSGTLQADGSAFAEERWDDAPPRQVIGEEKWAALFPQGFQAWSEWRRTGYPELIPAPEATNNGEIPRRYVYPSEEAGVNESNYNDALQLLTPSEDVNTSRFWWDIE